jgi:putative spermidine/putrescine transport system permease protein
VLIAVLTLVLGYPLAYAAVRLPRRVAAVILVCVALPYFSSALVRTYAWQIILADNGPINRALLILRLVDSPVQLVYNNVGVVIGTTQVLLPLMVFTCYSAMRQIDRSLPLAARSMGATPFGAWRTTFLPMSSQGVFAGLGLVFISALGFYVTPVLLQGPSTPLLSQRISALIAIPGERPNVAAQSTIMLVLVLALLVAIRRPLGLVLPGGDGGSRTVRTVGGAGRVADLFRSPGLHRISVALSRAVSAVRYPVLGLLVVLALAVLLGPLIVIVGVASSSASYLTFPPPGFSTRWYQAYLTDSAWLDSTRFSLWVCVFAALIATAAGAMAAFAIVRSRNRRLTSGVYLLLVAPMVMPQVILAVGMYYTLAPTGLLGQPFAVLLSYVVISMPIAVVVLTAVFRNLDPLLERAASSLGASPVTVARTVVVPLVLPGLISAVLFGFITGFDDLVMAQFLGGFNAQTLVRRMYESIRVEVSPQVAAVGTLLIAAIVVVGLLMFLLTARRTRKRAA